MLSMDSDPERLSQPACRDDDVGVVTGVLGPLVAWAAADAPPAADDGPAAATVADVPSPR